MLLDIKCAAVTSIQVHLTFDDNVEKECLIAKGDLIDCLYNANGMRKHIIGKVVNISAIGSDPTGWYIVVDGSDDFEGRYARFSPMSILCIDILRKADQETFISTPLGQYAVPYLRIVKGRLQYSIDGYKWEPIIIDNRDIIEEQEGTVPVCKCNDDSASSSESTDDGGIEEAVW